MNTATDKKTAPALDGKTDTTLSPADNVSATTSAPTKDNAIDVATEKFRQAIKSIDAERAESLKSAIENLKPGRTFNSNVVRSVNKLETKRNRLIVAHLAWLLKNHPDSVHAIVHQIIEL